MNGCFRKPAGEAKNKPGASAERLQPWRELASHDLCQLAWIFRRHSWHVQRDLEVWSHDRGCVGGVQASHLYLHPQARWVAWWCLGGHWSGHQPWEDGDSAIQKGFALPRFLVFLELCPFELADVQLAASAIYARIPQNTPDIRVHIKEVKLQITLDYYPLAILSPCIRVVRGLCDPF